jgi:hypothetical protein
MHPVPARVPERPRPLPEQKFRRFEARGGVVLLAVVLAEHACVSAIQQPVNGSFTLFVLLAEGPRPGVVQQPYGFDREVHSRRQVQERRPVRRPLPNQVRLLLKDRSDHIRGLPRLDRVEQRRIDVGHHKGLQRRCQTAAACSPLVSCLPCCRDLVGSSKDGLNNISSLTSRIVEGKGDTIALRYASTTVSMHVPHRLQSTMEEVAVHDSGEIRHGIRAGDRSTTAPRRVFVGLRGHPIQTDSQSVTHEMRVRTLTADKQRSFVLALPLDLREPPTFAPSCSAFRRSSTPTLLSCGPQCFCGSRGARDAAGRGSTRRQAAHRALPRLGTPPDLRR